MFPGHEVFNELAFLEKLDLTFDRYKHKFDEYDKANSYLFSRFALFNEPVYQLILHSTGVSLMLIASVVVPLIMLKKDIKDIKEASRNVTEYLKTGDKVKLDGCLGEFLGISEQKLKIRFKDTVIYIPFERAWRLNKYEGKAKRVNKYIHRPNPKVAKAKDYLCELLNLDETELPPVVKSKTLIVCDKHAVCNNLTNICFGNIPFTNILPAGYYNKKDEFERIGSDPLQRMPVVCFTASMGNAIEMIQNDPDIKSVVIYKTQKLKGHFTSLRELQKRLNNIIVLGDISDIDFDDIGYFLSLNFRIHSWTPEELGKLTLAEPSPSNNHFTRSRRVLKALVNQKCHIVNTQALEENIIEDIKHRLEKIRKSHFESDFKVPFISKSYSLLTYLRTMPLLLSEEQYAFCQTTVNQLEELKTEMFMAVNKLTFNDFGFVIEGLKSLINFYTKYHSKHRTFTDLVKTLNYNDCIVVNKDNQKEILRRWLKANCFNCRPQIISLNEFKTTKSFFNKAIFSGWFGEKHTRIFLNPSSNEQYLILYPFEEKWFRASQERLNNKLKKVSCNLTGQNVKHELQAEEDDMDTYIGNALNSLGYISNTASKLQVGEVNPTTEAYFVEFEEEYVAFLTDGYNCRCLSEEEENVIKKKVKELNTNDNLIFIKDSSEDIFEKLVKTVEESNPHIKELVLLSGLWRTALQEFKAKTRYSYENIQKLLKKHGVSRVTATIKSWINDESCIGPEDDAIRAITLMTGHQELLVKTEEVITACKKIRALHVQLGRYLARSVISSLMANSINQEDDMLQKITDDLTKYVQTVTVKRISKEKFIVPVGRTNRLLDK
ncbi:DrmE family protein [Desulforamulus hydrothermalis]|uniref:DISARM protein DrmE C-terminal domain-containing protein n=1 Tax=Desulforamulus hydrothermalis Lam5 = DSM 18033 TaxID=1121428 RepID=K8DYY6_9FIRM|nr:DrmE family protein [Desulforamulus hydrothermalis]CCO08065.1 hypothetical protein DESHY_160189 [Desulforamulus hydrothermalis Lam5 = DSM 18033]SHG82862.1 hypothetical protein SAMN02745177_00485 [Desulforamulus hydrothermalis Lam5 = DSM 18033]